MSAEQLPAAKTVDPLPRTSLSWQRTMLVLAAAAAANSVALIGSNREAWVIPVLLLGALPMPLAVRRGRELLHEDPPPVRRSTLAITSGAAVAQAVLAVAV